MKTKIFLIIILSFLSILKMKGQDIYQYALRPDIIKTNKVKSVCVFESPVDSFCAEFNKNGLELTDHFFIKDSSNMRAAYKPDKDHIIKDSLDRIIKIIQPEPYTVCEITFEFLDTVEIERHFYRKNNSEGNIYKRYYDNKRNLLKEVRLFPDETVFVFLYKYNSNNLLESITNAGGTVFWLKYEYLK